MPVGPPAPRDAQTVCSLDAAAWTAKPEVEMACAPIDLRRHASSEDAALPDESFEDGPLDLSASRPGHRDHQPIRGVKKYILMRYSTGMSTGICVALGLKKLLCFGCIAQKLGTGLGYCCSLFLFSVWCTNF